MLMCCGGGLEMFTHCMGDDLLGDCAETLVVGLRCTRGDLLVAGTY